jgi:predicted small lipoprotein YifL
VRNLIHNPKEKIAVLKALFVVSFTLSALSIVVYGCGKKGPPEPPIMNRPPAVRDLNYKISNNTIKLSWTIPKVVKKGVSPTTGFIVYRAKLTRLEADCPNCPIRYVEVGDVPVRGAGTEGGASPAVVFAQKIEKGYYYYYKIVAYNDLRAFSRDSNVVEFSF